MRKSLRTRKRDEVAVAGGVFFVATLGLLVFLMFGKPHDAEGAVNRQAASPVPGACVKNISPDGVQKASCWLVDTQWMTLIGVARPGYEVTLVFRFRGEKPIRMTVPAVGNVEFFVKPDSKDRKLRELHRLISSHIDWKLSIRAKPLSTAKSELNLRLQLDGIRKPLILSN